MLAPSGQYLKKYLGESSLYFPASMWISLQPFDSGQSAAFSSELTAALDLWASSSHTYHRVKRVSVFSALIWFCQVNLSIRLFL